MNRVILFCAGCCLLAAPLAAIEPAPERFPLEKKLLGAWQGDGGCDGDFVFHADGTYELTAYGPVGAEYAGVWEVKWDALPPTLVLTIKAADVEEEVGRVEAVKLIVLNDAHLAIEYASNNGFSGKYTRAKK